MRKGFDRELFFDHLPETHWFKETVELYFSGQYRLMYDTIMKDFLNRGIVKTEDGMLVTTVKP
ncbi:MAG: hypothetical protein JSV31_25400 [Desulfobacterales bacterium]|nr:MAG: hypothetical protein JSV31_25400 [Desulfobacterales bacterium]